MGGTVILLPCRVAVFLQGVQVRYRHVPIPFPSMQRDGNAGLIEVPHTNTLIHSSSIGAKQLLHYH